MLSFYEEELGLTPLRRDGEIIELGPNKSLEPILILRHTPSAQKPPTDAAGLYHYALLVPDRRSLAATYLSLGHAGVIFDGFADHLVSEALYLNDPEGNGIEIYSDKPRSQWKFDEEDHVDMATQPLDVDSLLKEVSGAAPDTLKGIAEGTRIGHVHLKVTDLQRSIAFYTQALGFDIMRYYGSAAFLSVGGYHHHVGMNTWESLGGKTLNKDWTGLEHFTMAVPSQNFDELSSILADSPYAQNQGTGQLFISDPDNIELLLRAS